MTNAESLTGTIKNVNAIKGFGFILGSDGVEYFFHRSASTDFQDLVRGTPVRFVPVPGGGPKGPRAERVELL
jgi:cold shock CspA family protein